MRAPFPWMKGNLFGARRWSARDRSGPRAKPAGGCQRLAGAVERGLELRRTRIDPAGGTDLGALAVGVGKVGDPVGAHALGEGEAERGAGPLSRSARSPAARDGHWPGPAAR